MNCEKLKNHGKNHGIQLVLRQTRTSDLLFIFSLEPTIRSLKGDEDKSAEGHN
jgi:hypothetical protein